jgi:hypothetical protein
MHHILRTIGCASFLGGSAWVVQTSGLGTDSLFATSPSFFLLGAGLAGAGAAAMACTMLLRADDEAVAVKS